jgi:hypothetical protein
MGTAASRHNQRPLMNADEHEGDTSADRSNNPQMTQMDADKTKIEIVGADLCACPRQPKHFH